MNETAPATYFAPAGRVSERELQAQIDATIHDPIVDVILDAVDGYVLILNEQRQVLAANHELLQALNIVEKETIYGLRPGEVISCTHPREGPDGCGTSHACRGCGAVMAVMACQNQDRTARGECSLTVRRDGELKACEFHVQCTPLKLHDYVLTVFVFHDISAQKRRDVLERVFIHDLRNTLIGLMGWSELLADATQEEAAAQLVMLSQQISRDVDDQYMLIRAERSELELHIVTMTAQEMLGKVEHVFHEHYAARDKHLIAEVHTTNDAFDTDESLLLRVLVNMIKNALEASRAGETVKIWFDRRDGFPCFHVWNKSCISDDIAVKIFQRSFTTKQDLGRGLGAYSMKLFGENYLKGKVSFTTSPDLGTTFTIELPV